MWIALRPATFRILALALGSVGLVAMIALHGVLFVPVVVGIAFGVGGWIVDFLTGFRRLGGELSSIALAAGGGVVIVWLHFFELPSLGAHTPIWPYAIQYASSVLVCWGILTFVAPRIAGRHVPAP
jgi:hypothetical protein